MTTRSGPAWRLILDEARTGAANMAIDDALFERVQAGGRPVLRLYHWDPPCLSLGRNQVVDRMLAERVASRGGQLVRRPTGGAAVWHDREVTYAVTGPVEALGRPRDAYAGINRALVEGLRCLGVPASLAGPAGVGARAEPGVGVPCFAGAEAGEVLVGGRKLIGSAQRRVGPAVLQHGSILLDGHQADADVRAEGPSAGPVAVAAGPVAHPITLREVMGRAPAREDVHAAVVAGFEAVFGVRLRPDTLTPGERARARALTAHYASDAWTWRH